MPWQTYYRGFYRVDPPDAFAEIAIHESRHSWQFTLGDRRGIHLIHNLLFAPGSIPPTSAELIDAGNVDGTPGGNGDGNFKGDSSDPPDIGDAVKAMIEHNAMRFTKRNNLSLTVDCALSGFSKVSGDGQTGPVNQPLPQPLVVKVVEKKWDDVTKQVVNVASAGTTIKFTILGGTATVNGGSVAYAMTGNAGLASVPVTNGSGDSQILAQLLPPMAPQNVCPSVLILTQTFTVHVQ